MGEHERYNSKRTFSKGNPDSASTLKKMQYQLDAIERKLDSLLRQSGSRDFKSSYPSKPRREYDNSKRPFKPNNNKENESARGKEKFYSGLQSGPKRVPGKSSFMRKKRSS